MEVKNKLQYNDLGCGKTVLLCAYTNKYVDLTNDTYIPTGNINFELSLSS